jgi:hypothetical protein
MGTVHGVYLKYVGLSALSYAGYSLIAREKTYDHHDDGSSSSTSTASSRTYIHMMDMATRLIHPFLSSILGVINVNAVSSLLTKSSVSSSITTFRDYDNVSTYVFQTIPACILAYSTILNGVIAILFKCEIGMKWIGKDRTTGQIPLWSQIIYFPFHIPTRLYTYLHSLQDKKKNIPVASEVQPGWYVGGCYGHELIHNSTNHHPSKPWAGVIDLTVEFPETTIGQTHSYLSLPTWDGIPATPEQLEEGANFALAAYQSKKGNILIHCAHGRGRSTTMMCAALVKAGLFPTWEEAFEKGIKPGRSVCKLNRRMKQNLTEWQRIYVDGKKGQ